jgi:hypothetical protein
MHLKVPRLHTLILMIFFSILEIRIKEQMCVCECISADIIEISTSESVHRERAIHKFFYVYAATNISFLHFHVAIVFFPLPP